MTTRLKNFGGNQRWAARRYRPASEAEVLEILERHRQGCIRATGSLHSWSAIAASSDASLDMSAFDQVELHQLDGRQVARVGAGCSLERLLSRLRRLGGLTLPTLGAIKRQTISGAVSTGTHGSGTQSLSHFVVGARLAAYDAASGKPAVFEYRDGDELRAARCGLGCVGILLSLDLIAVPQYRVEERVSRQERLERVLQAYQNYPLTQFALVPYAWQYLLFERRATAESADFRSLLLRLYNTVWIDVLFHLSVKAALMAGSSAVKTFLRLSPRLSAQYRRFDDAERVLTLGHHYFRHEEMEFFVPESRLAEALELLRSATEVFAGEPSAPSAPVTAKLDALGLYGGLERARGSYVQHYPFSIRRLLPEDTLVSMGSEAREPLYAVSVFTYQRPDERQGYYHFCEWLARCMSALFGAKLHWGKHFPLNAKDVAPLYPRLGAFSAICRKTDPRGVFRNPFIDRVLASGT